MAASSSRAAGGDDDKPKIKLCLYCEAETPEADLMKGWALRSGGFAQLCVTCGTAYQDGTFCDQFHSKSDGWRDCVTCKKLVHCGCIMAAHTFMILDFGGVRCMDCLINDFTLEPIPSPSPSWNDAAGNEDSIDSSEDVVSADPSQESPEDSHEEGTTAPAGSAHPIALANEMNAEILVIAATSQEQAPVSELGKQPLPNALDKTCASSDSHMESRKVQGTDPGQSQLQLENLLMKTDKEVQEIGGEPSSGLILLFGKTLTASDTDPKNGRLILPKKYAEEFFPKISEPQGIPLVVQDTNGNDWVFYFRSWANNKSTMYVLEGMKDFMASMHVEAGDTAAFYRTEQGGKLVIGFLKAPRQSDPKSFA